MQRGPKPSPRAAALALLAFFAAGALASPGEACTLWTTGTQAELHFNPAAPVTYWVQADGSADVDFASLKDAIFAAFDQWSEVTCGSEAPQLAFAFADDLDLDPVNFDPRLFRDEKNMVTFINEGWEGDPLVLARARILWNEDTGEIMEFGIALNDQYADWTTNPDGEPGKYDVQSVLARQIGLILGLGDSEVQDAIMFPGFSENSTAKRVLSNDDALAICDLYAPGRSSWTEAPAEMSCTRALHPGAQPANPNNNAGNNNTNGSNNNTSGSNNNTSGGSNNGTGNNSSPVPGGVGASCVDASDCEAALLCGCPASLGTCATDICYAPEDTSGGAVGAEDDDGCAVAPTRVGSASALWLLVIGGLVWGLRRRM